MSKKGRGTLHAKPAGIAEDITAFRQRTGALAALKEQFGEQMKARRERIDEIKARWEVQHGGRRRLHRPAEVRAIFDDALAKGATLDELQAFVGSFIAAMEHARRPAAGVLSLEN